MNAPDFSVGSGDTMTLFFILLALSALLGYIIGRNHFRWHAILAAAMVLAPLSAVMLQSDGFRGAPSGISAVVTCLTINQMAYLIGWLRVSSGPKGRSVEDLPQ